MNGGGANVNIFCVKSVILFMRLNVDKKIAYLQKKIKSWNILKGKKIPLDIFFFFVQLETALGLSCAFNLLLKVEEKELLINDND